jgi:hypothetical protein
VIQDGGELVPAVLGDDLPWFAEFFVGALRRGVVAQVAVDDRARPGVAGIVLLDPGTDRMPPFVGSSGLTGSPVTVSAKAIALRAARGSSTMRGFCPVRGPQGVCSSLSLGVLRVEGLL